MKLALPVLDCETEQTTGQLLHNYSARRICSPPWNRKEGPFPPQNDVNVPTREFLLSKLRLLGNWKTGQGVDCETMAWR